MRHGYRTYRNFPDISREQLTAEHEKLAALRGAGFAALAQDKVKDEFRRLCDDRGMCLQTHESRFALHEAYAAAITTAEREEKALAAKKAAEARETARIAESKRLEAKAAKEAAAALRLKTYNEFREMTAPKAGDSLTAYLGRAIPIADKMLGTGSVIGILRALKNDSPGLTVSPRGVYPRLLELFQEQYPLHE